MGEPKAKMDRFLRVLFGGNKYPPKVCRCFSLKVGATIVGELDWVVLVGVKYIIPRPTFIDGHYDHTFSTAFFGESYIMGVILFIFKIIFFFAAQTMVIGNIKGNKELMRPFEEIKLMELAGLATLYTIMLPLAYLFEDRQADAAITFGISIVVIALSMYFFLVVKFRIYEIDAQVRLTHHDVETPTYGTDGHTLTYCANGSSTVHFISESLVSPPDGESQIRRSSTI